MFTALRITVPQKILFFIPVILIICWANAHSQYPFPSDSVFRPGQAAVSFNYSIVNPEYYCEHPWPPDTNFLPKTSNGSSLFITPTSELITDSATLGYLTYYNAKLEPVWSECADPCAPRHRYEISACGDTLRFPYWTEYVVHFSPSISPVAFTYGLVMTRPQSIHTIRPIRKRWQYVTSSVPNDPEWLNQTAFMPVDQNSQRWGSNIEEAWNYSTGDPAIKIAVFDGTFHSGHEDFYDINSTNIVFKYNFVDNSPNLTPPNPYANHGLEVSGIVGSLRNNRDPSGLQNVGIAGIAGGDWESDKPGCELYLCEVTYPHGEDRDDFSRVGSAMISALDRVVGEHNCVDGVRIINMSFNNGYFWTDHQRIYESGADEIKALARTYRRCAVVTNSRHQRRYSGNTSPIDPYYYYDLPNGYNDQWIIGTANSNLEDGSLFTDCSWGGNIRLMAPGTAVRTLAYNGYVQVGPGSSFSAPQVAGTAGLILSYAKDQGKILLNDDVAGLMEGTARKTGYRQDQDPTGDVIPQNNPYDEHTGFGALDAGAAVSRVNDVQRGYIDLGTLSPSEYDERVELTAIDPDPDGNNPNLTIRVNYTEEDDPYNTAYESYDDSTYVWQRYKLEVGDIVLGVPGQTLDHAWGIGMGHGHIPTTTGWEEGVIYVGMDNRRYKLCSQTPYSKVNYDEFDADGRSFSLFTYVYKLRVFYNADRSKYDDYWYPEDPRNAVLSYGYLLSGTSHVVGAPDPASDLTVVSIVPNPMNGPDCVVRFSTMKSDRFKIEVINALGEVFKTMDLGRVSPGMHDVPLSMHGSANGVYICRITGTNSMSGSCVKTFIVHK